LKFVIFKKFLYNLFLKLLILRILRSYYFQLFSCYFSASINQRQPH